MQFSIYVFQFAELTARDVAISGCEQAFSVAVLKSAESHIYIYNVPGLALIPTQVHFQALILEKTLGSTTETSHGSQYEPWLKLK